MPPEAATVLITRPRAAAQELAGALGNLGYKTVIEPLLTITPINAPAPDLNSIGASIITSANAVDMLAPRHAQIGALLMLPCFCVGSETTAKAAAFGFRDARDAKGDGAALAKLIIASGAKGPFLHITGRDTDPEIQDALRDAGRKTAPWPIYAAEAANALSPAVIEKLEQKRLNAVLLFSARTAETLKTLLTRHALEACCKDLIAIGISKAVTGMLQPLPWRRLKQAAQPNEKAVIERLCKLLPIS